MRCQKGGGTVRLGHTYAWRMDLPWGSDLTTDNHFPQRSFFAEQVSSSREVALSLQGDSTRAVDDGTHVPTNRGT